jgi:glutamine amidotransferase
MKLKIAIIDYGVGNTRSVFSALAALGYEATVTSQPAKIAASQALVLPGVGAFGPAAERLRERGLADTLGEQVLVRRKPILGICLGMQLMATDSEENGLHRGLNWIPGHVRRLTVPRELAVPHVGWNDVQVAHRAPLFSRTGDQPAFYFDHSYHFVCGDDHRAAICDYGGAVTAAVQRDNIFGVQFHPEKSQINGLRLLRGLFLSVAAAC